MRRSRIERRRRRWKDRNIYVLRVSKMIYRRKGWRGRRLKGRLRRVEATRARQRMKMRAVNWKVKASMRATVAWSVRMTVAYSVRATVPWMARRFERVTLLSFVFLVVIDLELEFMVV